MAWSNPRTWADGELVNATLLNAQLRDNLSYLLAPNIVMLKTAAGNITTTSTTLATLGPAWSLNLTTNSGYLNFGAQFVVSAAAAAAGAVTVAVTVDGVPYTAYYQVIGAPSVTVSFNQIMTGINSGAHTVALQWRTDVGTVTGVIDPTKIPLIFWAKEA